MAKGGAILEILVWSFHATTVTTFVVVGVRSYFTTTSSLTLPSTDSLHRRSKPRDVADDLIHAYGLDWAESIGHWRSSTNPREMCLQMYREKPRHLNGLPRRVHTPSIISPPVLDERNPSTACTIDREQHS